MNAECDIPIQFRHLVPNDVVLVNCAHTFSEFRNDDLFYGIYYIGELKALIHSIDLLDLVVIQEVITLIQFYSELVK